MEHKSCVVITTTFQPYHTGCNLILVTMTIRSYLCGYGENINLTCSSYWHDTGNYIVTGTGKPRLKIAQRARKRLARRTLTQR